MKNAVVVSLLSLLSLVSSAVYAGETKSCAEKGNKTNWDYSDAPASYGTACHLTPYWQRLGDSWDSDTVADSQVEGSDNASDDGVVWRVSSDEGQSWSEYGNDVEITQGDQVEFQYTFNRSETGWHYFDQLKSWFDWDIDGSFDNSDIVTEINWNKLVDSDKLEGDALSDEQQWGQGGYNGLWSDRVGYDVWNNGDTQLVYTQTIEIPLDAVTGETWMRARVVCSNSLSNYASNMTMDATGFQDQGEVEDYKLTILAKSTPPPTDVPEPTGLVLFASALAFLGSRKFKQMA